MNVIALDECKGRILSNDEVRMVAISFSNLEEHHTALQKSHESLRAERDELFRRIETLRMRLTKEAIDKEPLNPLNNSKRKESAATKLEGLFESLFGKG